MRKSALLILVALGTFIAAMTATAFASTSMMTVVAGAGSASGSAAGAASSAPDGLSAILDMLRPIYDAFAHGSYVYAGALALVLAVALVKRYLGDKIPWMHSDAGGASMALLGALGAALAASLAGGSGLTLAIAWHAVAVAAGAAGGYTLVNKLIINPLRPYVAKAPVWVQSIFALVAWIFNGPAETAQEAQAAGDAAVAAKPAPGVAGTLGAPKDVK